MKSSDLIVLGLAGVAVYMIAKSKGISVPTTISATGGRAPVEKTPASWVSEIFNGSGGRFDNGWRYFSNGTAISPEGDYYKDGQLIWTAGAVTA